MKIITEVALLDIYESRTKIPQALFLVSEASSETCNFVKKILWHSCFPVNFAKISRARFWQNTSEQLIQHYHLIETQKKTLNLNSFPERLEVNLFFAQCL